ncbi:MAG TPA: hypothetical protein VJH95_06190 [Candidatus Nanoarchaeia archaeon]|nr:hypothetical protein [Candidatus Nanoarchaeia archaeon]
MPILSVSIPNELKHQMDNLEEINWSAVARKAFEEKVQQMLFLHQLAAKSKLTNKDALKLSNKISRSISKKFREMS